MVWLISIVAWLLVSSSLALLPAYMAGARPSSWLARMWMEKSVSEYSYDWSYDYRWMWIAGCVFPPAAGAFAAFFAVAIVCLGLHHVLKTIGSLPEMVQKMGELRWVRKMYADQLKLASAALPKVTVRSVTLWRACRERMKKGHR